MKNLIVSITVTLVFFVARSIEGETTPIDNNYFLFKHANAFAIKTAGTWKASKPSIKLGIKGRQFVIDATQSEDVPESCRKTFSTDVPVDPQSMPLPGDYGNVQYTAFWHRGCSANLWIKGPISYQYQERFESSNIKPPQDKSVVVGMVEFNDGKVRRLVHFAVPVDEVQMPR